MTRLSPEFESILGKYEKHKLDTYRVAELLGDDYVFTEYGDDKKDNRYRDLINCGTFLEFSKEDTAQGNIYHLKASNFCRQRVCPMCQFRKSEKMFVEVLRVVQSLQNDYRFLHMVLTVPNSRYERELVTSVRLLYKAFGYLISHGKPKKAFKGILRCLEVSYNYDNDTYHPHLHCLVAVTPSYFNDTKVYISHEHLREIWTKAVSWAIDRLGDSADFARSEHLLQCSIRACKEGDYRGVAEVCKYCVKPLDLDKTAKSVQNKRVILALFHVLKGTRFVQKYGIFKRLLSTSIDEDGEEGSITTSEEGDSVAFLWDSATMQYRSDRH